MAHAHQACAKHMQNLTVTSKNWTLTAHECVFEKNYKNYYGKHCYCDENYLLGFSNNAVGQSEPGEIALIQIFKKKLLVPRILFIAVLWYTYLEQ